MKLLEIPIEVAEKEEIKIGEELNIEPEWIKTPMTINPKHIVSAFADDNKDGIEKTIIYTNAHADSRDSTVVLLPYEIFREMWRNAIEE